MWVFGYGSLLCDHDPWESGFGCVRRVLATLERHRRSFNKSSVERWGTNSAPGPTLNLVRDEAKSCWGVAFEFPDVKRAAVLDYLSKREGKSFELCEHRIDLANGDQILAIIPVYTGKNLIDHKSLQERAEMVLNAKGKGGCCYDYVRQIVDKLAELKIDDSEVAEFWQAVESARQVSGQAV